MSKKMDDKHYTERKYRKFRKKGEVIGAIKRKVDIDWQKVSFLLNSRCTIKEIAGFFDCSEDVIYSRFEQGMGISYKEWSERQKYKGDAMLRSKQFQEAMQGNNRMLVLLGKERLGQTDTQQQVITQKTTQKCILELPDNGNRSPNQTTGRPSDTVFQD